MKFYNKALEIATREHAGQKRWDGSPYINHPIAVARIAGENNKSLITTLSAYDTYENLLITAIFHDVFEDTKYSMLNFREELLGEGLSNGSFNEICTALFYLNKNNFSSYLEYILGAKFNWMARQVKIADITHNLSDLKKGSMKDKYELALYILKSE